MTEGYTPKKKVEKAPRTESIESTFVKGQLRELKKLSALTTGRSVYEDLTRRLLRAEERKSESVTPQELEPLIKAINHTIAEHLQKQVNAAEEFANTKADPSTAKHRLVNFEVQLSRLKEPLEPHVGQNGMPEREKPSPLQFAEEDKQALFASAEKLSDSLYDLPQMAEFTADPNAAELPPEIDSKRLAYLKDRVVHVLQGRGILGFHRYDEMQEIIAILEKSAGREALQAELLEMTARIPEMEMENLFADVLPKAKYWRDRESVPAEESTSRSSDRNLRDAFADTFIEWRKRKTLSSEVLEKNERRFEQLHNAFGTLRNNVLVHNEFPNVPPLE